ncbi:sensor histidine kinase [Propionibacterium australiense]|uniref:histidine kinase n=2 Tax=Propionibacterium australiense TaxID=119981 RepID=A0A8B3FNM0_9ACTN|nr:sensor histidine kinase [Propionibacterium australiense]RLP07600.1 sensor histidine kinase [Propionibacterium australiense]RLP08390.1 sensor histidine kinase [Propionibacterium australiense]
MSFVPMLRHDTRRELITDAALAAVLTALTCFWGDVTFPYHDSHLATLLTSLPLTVSVVLRRRRPLIMLAIAAVGGLLQAVVLEAPSPSLIAVPIITYSVARWVPGRDSRLAVLVGFIGAIVGPYRWSRTPEPWIATPNPHNVFYLLFLICEAMVLIPYQIGRRTRENDAAELERELAAEAQYEAQLAAQAERARSIEARTRNEIARELHDVVAHSLSVITVQAQGGKALAAKNPDAAAQVLGTIADTSREALVEMRRIVGVLREGPAEYRPMPALSDIPAMTERAGDRVHLEVSGTAPVVPPTLALAAYRICQEAVTNFLKHAGPQATCWMRLGYEPDRIVIDVTDDGAGAAVTDDGGGNGLRGMSERATAMGGTASAGPRPEGGFAVHAELPLPQDD